MANLPNGGSRDPGTGVRGFGGGATEPNRSTQTDECGSWRKTQNLARRVALQNDESILTQNLRSARGNSERICGGPVRASER
jgi:hypothetical protein